MSATRLEDEREAELGGALGQGREAPAEPGCGDAARDVRGPQLVVIDVDGGHRSGGRQREAHDQLAGQRGLHLERSLVARGDRLSPRADLAGNRRGVDLAVFDLRRATEKRAGDGHVVDGGLPNLSWASTQVPYLGTKMGAYCIQYGFATDETAANPEDGYHERAVLRYVREWVGPELARRQDDDVWLSDTHLERYRDQNTHNM